MSENTDRTEYITPYFAAKLVEPVLRNAGLTPPKSLPQMMYNYTKGPYQDGKKPSIKYTNAEGVDRDDLVRWVKAYIERKRTPKTEFAPLDLG
jgi:hypothetical protein